MLVAAGVVPATPLLVPEVASGAAAELDDLRATALGAVGVLAAARADRLVVVGPALADEEGTCPAGSRGTFRGFGVELDVTLGPGTPEAGGRLPSSLAVAAWLLERAHWSDTPVTGLGVAETRSPQECRATGRELAASAPRTALLVVGDGSACRTVKAPGYLDPRAEDFDRRAARALAEADLDALHAVDATLAAELKASGRAPWQVLAGAAEGAGLRGELLADQAPYGVGYHVATWT
ncbi:class III extradiol dioxygenase subunit B-like domain-containing protein [Streptomyces sp. NPDC059740]|uniref:class III extradiol dioxygenase subunit B-like domain-containing protein n=1 Tax=Streptomyces sp. NPDC059740 TaxID=3346926 RepID=UPI0036470A60